MTWVVATAVLVFLLAVMALAFTATEGLERESRIISDEMESFRLYGQQLQEKNRALRRYRHDANTLVQAIEYALAQEGVRDQARESLAGGGMGDTARTGKMDEGKSESTQRSEAGALGRLGRKRPGGVRGAAAKACSGAEDGSLARTGLALVDAIVGFKRRQCADAGIAFAAEVSPKAPDALGRAGIPEGDVAAVVQNLLENAYEASLRMAAAAGPRIAFALECPSEGGVLVRVSNRVNSADAPAFRSRKPNPERHGLGMRIVDDIAHSHAGTRRADFDPATRTLHLEVRLRC